MISDNVGGYAVKPREGAGAVETDALSPSPSLQKDDRGQIFGSRAVRSAPEAKAANRVGMAIEDIAKSLHMARAGTLPELDVVWTHHPSMSAEANRVRRPVTLRGRRRSLRRACCQNRYRLVGRGSSP